MSIETTGNVRAVMSPDELNELRARVPAEMRVQVFCDPRGVFTIRTFDRNWNREASAKSRDWRAAATEAGL